MHEETPARTAGENPSESLAKTLVETHATNTEMAEQRLSVTV
jgi:hypothetical protein